MRGWSIKDVKNIEKKKARKLPKRYGGFLPCQNEHALKDEITADLMDKPEIRIAYSNYNGGIYDAKRKAYRAFKGVKGRPDSEFLSMNCMLGGFECKKDGGYPTKEQKEWGEMILTLGGVWACVWSFEQYEYEYEKQKHKLL